MSLNHNDKIAQNNIEQNSTSQNNVIKFFQNFKKYTRTLFFFSTHVPYDLKWKGLTHLKDLEDNLKGEIKFGTNQNSDLNTEFSNFLKIMIQKFKALSENFQRSTSKESIGSYQNVIQSRQTIYGEIAQALDLFKQYLANLQQVSHVCKQRLNTILNEFSNQGPSGSRFYINMALEFEEIFSEQSIDYFFLACVN